jgi:hypothetical protein
LLTFKEPRNLDSKESIQPAYLLQIGLSYWPARLHRLVESILKRLQIRALHTSMDPARAHHPAYHPQSLQIKEALRARGVVPALLILPWPAAECDNFERSRRAATTHAASLLRPAPTEMEFLDINVKKDSSLLLHAVHSPFYWRILRRTILYSGYKNTFKKSANKRKLEFVHE